MEKEHQPSAPQPCVTGLAPVVERNIQALLDRRRVEESKLSWQERLGISIGTFSGSMPFVFLHLFVYGGWILFNSGVVSIPGIPRFDPTMVILAMVASVESIFLSTFILITQNRMMAQADRRADLNLQISLLAEHEITRLITMTRELTQRMGIEAGRQPELDELSKDVAPEQVLETIEDREQRSRRRDKAA